MPQKYPARFPNIRTDIEEDDTVNKFIFIIGRKKRD